MGGSQGQDAVDDGAIRELGGRALPRRGGGAARARALYCNGTPHLPSPRLQR